MSAQPDPDPAALPGLGKGRIEALTDGIFATVMTVLVLTLSVPLITGSLTSDQLGQDLDASLRALIPNVISYTMSFLLLG